MPKPASESPYTEIKPNPSLEMRTRRKFTADYKSHIVMEAKACKHSALLRRP